MSPAHRELAHRLGYAGLVPFVLGSLLIWLIGDRNLDQHTFVSMALSAWAGLVIALLGGIHWGLSFVRNLPGRLPLVWGAGATLLGWLGVLIACYVVDRRVYPMLGAADWLTLRFRLTLVAALSCFLAAAGS